MARPTWPPWQSRQTRVMQISRWNLRKWIHGRSAPSSSGPRGRRGGPKASSTGKACIVTIKLVNFMAHPMSAVSCFSCQREETAKVTADEKGEVSYTQWNFCIVTTVSVLQPAVNVEPHTRHKLATTQLADNPALLPRQRNVPAPALPHCRIYPDICEQACKYFRIILLMLYPVKFGCSLAFCIYEAGQNHRKQVLSI